LQAAEFPVAPDNMGAFWIDLAADGCTMFYTSWGLPRKNDLTALNDMTPHDARANLILDCRTACWSLIRPCGRL
jgi:hypothetical protein